MRPSLRLPPPARFPGRPILVGLAVVLARGALAAPHPASTPGDFQLHPALEISLFAQEPDVVDPVALTFDELGRAYVVEMRDYPYGFGPGRKPGGTIRLLEDTDGDGRADRSTLFAEGLSFPTSLAAWNGGVLVTAAPDLLFLKDTDGDRRADVREVVLTGFKLGVTDSNLSGMRHALDNWFHVVNGGNGGEVRSPGRPAAPVRLGDRDFRFRPATGEVELTAQTGGGFGLAFDDWGRSFTPHNINHLQQRVADADDFARYPGLPPVETTHSISDHGEMARIYPISPAVTRPNHPEQAGHFSAAGGMGFIGHPGWPGDLPGSVLVCDVVGNLVHRDLLVPDGPILRATRPPSEQTREFLASRDNFFRPVGLEAGPDGALYLVDMQRDVIEHPDYIPKKLLEKLDLRAGEDRGRIYRIAPRGWPTTRELPGQAAPESLVGLLGSPNPWTRLTAQRLLVHRQDLSVVDALRRRVLHRAAPGDTASGARPERARLHALWTLDGLGALDETCVLAALTDSEPGIRESAVTLAAARFPASVSAASTVIDRFADPELPVRFAALRAAGAFDQKPPADRVADNLWRDRAWPWLRRAALAALTPGDEAATLAFLVGRSAGADPAGAEATAAALRELAELTGARAGTLPPGASSPIDAALALEPSGSPLRIALLEGLRSGLQRAARVPPLSPGAAEALRRQMDPHQPAQLAAAWRLARLFGLPEGPAQTEALASAVRVARDASAPLPARLDAIRLVDLGSLRDSGPVLFALLDGREPAILQQAALAALRDHREPEVGAGLARAWPSLSPSLRPAVVNLLVYRGAFHEALLSALEAGSLQVGELNLDLEHRRQLLRKAPPDIRARAARFTSDEEYSNRKAAVDEWLARLPATGEATRGRAVFERACSQCHFAAGLGFQVGPELTAQGHRSVEDLLSNILDPNMAMNPAYVAFTAELTDGESATGILAAESADTITLIQAGANRVTIPRNQLRQLKADGRSLMPDGLEAGLTPADLRDLIAFLQAPAPNPVGSAQP